MTTKQFKNVNGVYLLKELFFEMAQNRENVVYTLKNEDHEGYPSLYRLYMEANDPTEYSFAVQNLGGWEHWKTLSECTWMKALVQKWRDELEVRARSQALSSIMQKASGKDREAFQAAKYIAEGWGEGKTSNKRGRPSKDEIRANAEEINKERQRLNEDYLRLVQ